jgi:solute carrier family 13 (sodium-dependent dicarboxylate transporter), member 2/3/5
MPQSATAAPKDNSSMPEASPVRSPRQRIGLVLGIALFALILVAPTPSGMNPEGQRVAAVAVLMATWWISEAIAIALTSLLPLALFPVLGIMASERVAPYYTDHTIFLYFGGFVVALTIQKWNLHKRIALHTIALVGTDPARLMLGFMIATAFLSMWMSNTACAMMMYPIGMAVVLQLAGQGAPNELVTRNFGSVLMLAIAYASSIGGIGTLIGTPPNLVFAGAVRNLFPEAPEIGFLQWMTLGVPVVLVYIPLTWVYLCRFGARVPLREIRFSGGQTVIADEIRKLGAIGWQEKYILGVWTAMALLWVFRADIRLGSLTIPGWSGLFGRPAFIQDATVAMAMALLLCLTPSRARDEKAGRHMIDWESIRQGVPWGVLFLFGGGFALAAGFEQTGLSGWIGGALSRMEGLSPVTMIVLTSIVLMVLTEVTSNTASAVMAMPVLAAAAVQMHIHPFLLMIPGTIAVSCAFMLPVSTPPNAIVFGSGWITVPQMARAGVWLDILGIFVVTAAVWLLGTAIFDITPTQLPVWAQ